jgi:hypothetical protein
MRMPLSTLRVAALASVVAWFGTTPTTAAPKFVPGTLAVQPDIIKVDDRVQIDSARIIRRDRLHRHDGAWGNKRRHFRERRHDDRDHDNDGRDRLYQPKATQKFAYDGYGNLRIYDGDGWGRDWDERDRWHGDRRDWDEKKRRKRPRIYKMNSLGYQEPSPGLKGILTTVPD